MRYIFHMQSYVRCSHFNAGHQNIASNTTVFPLLFFVFDLCFLFFSLCRFATCVNAVVVGEIEREKASLSPQFCSCFNITAAFFLFVRSFFLNRSIVVGFWRFYCHCVHGVQCVHTSNYGAKRMSSSCCVYAPVQLYVRCLTAIFGNIPITFDVPTLYVFVCVCTVLYAGSCMCTLP